MLQPISEARRHVTGGPELSFSRQRAAPERFRTGLPSIRQSLAKDWRRCRAILRRNRRFELSVLKAAT
jgi:hypothetical protein